MTFIEKQTNDTYFLHINVKPNSKKVTIEEDGKFLTMHLLSKPTKNKANKELINILRKKFNIASNQVQIVSGLKSNNKIIKLNFNRKTHVEEIMKKLTT